MNQFTFNSRSSYIVARMDWRTAYKAISAASRFARKSFIEAQRAYSADPSTKNSSAVANARWSRLKIRDEATNLLVARAEMKKEAALQYDAQRVSRPTQSSVTV